jgi:hypothetical protein
MACEGETELVMRHVDQRAGGQVGGPSLVIGMARRAFLHIDHAAVPTLYARNLVLYRAVALETACRVGSAKGAVAEFTARFEIGV